MSEDDTSTYKVKFTVTETVEVEPQMLENRADGDGVTTQDAVEVAREILHSAPAFDHLGYDPVEDATVSGIVEQRPTENGIERHHYRASKPEGTFHRFAKVDPRCPFCDSGGFEPSGRFRWTGDDGGVVGVTCEDCHNNYTIQFRAMDVAWTDDDANTYEAVAEGLLGPTYFSYPHADEYSHDGWEEADDD